MTNADVIRKMTEAKGAVVIDRWDGDSWGKCRPRQGQQYTHGRYPMHRAWTFLPPPEKERIVE